MPRVQEPSYANFSSSNIDKKNKHNIYSVYPSSV